MIFNECVTENKWKRVQHTVVGGRTVPLWWQKWELIEEKLRFHAIFKLLTNEDKWE